MNILYGSKGTFSAFIVAAAMGAWAHQAAPVKGVTGSDPASAEAYCHLKFPAIQPSTLGTSHPRLKSAGSGDLVDYYGPCNHNPRGTSEAMEQEIQHADQEERSYGG
jgi:hypothetical protein